MHSELLTAIFTLLSTVITILGGFAASYVRQKAKSDHDRDLYLSLVEAVTGAVKATAQTIVKRNGAGLQTTDAEAAKRAALYSAKWILGDQKLHAALVKYGEAGLERTLSTLVEAAVHDQKIYSAPFVSSKKGETAKEYDDGK